MPFGIGASSEPNIAAFDYALPDYDDKLAGVNVDKKIDSGIDSGSSHRATPDSVRRASDIQVHHDVAFHRKLRRFDPNLDEDVARGLERAVNDHDTEAEAELVDLLEKDSPYLEVRAAVRNSDDEDLPVNTVRAWVLGLLLVTIGSAMNMLFSLRYPSISITAFVAQLVAYPLGLLWDIVVPRRWRSGPFNYKEHALITIMANVSFANGGYAYATDTIVAMKGFYGIDFGWGFQLLTTFGTQMIGYGMAGMLRKFLVWPASMLWPSNFVNTSLFYALHDHTKTDPTKANGWGITRFKYFVVVFAISFVWYWFPGFIFQALSYFSFATWIAPNNVIVNQLFGYTSGLGLIPITFDWTMITGYNLSPLMYPWHGIANTLIGCFFWFAIMVVSLHFGGWAWGDYLVMSSSSSYDNMGNQYNVSRVLTPEFIFDEAAYKEYSPMFLSTTFALVYGLSFATIVALISHTVLFHGQEISTRTRLAWGDEPDIHTRMMKRYKEVPTWWYGGMFLVVLAMCLASILAYDTQLSWWAFFVALLIAAFFTIPVGMIQAITNIQIGLNVVTEFVIGYMQPGKPIGMMLFKTYGYITMVQALTFCQDLKLGHYMKVPPRAMFWGQTISTIWSSIVQIAVLNWAFGAIPDICDAENPSHFTCANGRVFFTASLVWGVIGPMRIFGPGQIYHKLLYFFIAGLLAPPVMYILTRVYPWNQTLRRINIPLIFGGTGNIPPATTLNYTSWGITGFFFNKIIRNKYRGWWSNYNYLTSAGLDCGLAISTIVIFLTLQLTDVSAPNWWGNTVITQTSDALGTAVLKTMPEGVPFGPSSW